MTVFRFARLVAPFRYSTKFLKTVSDLYELGSSVVELSTWVMEFFND